MYWYNFTMYTNGQQVFTKERETLVHLTNGHRLTDTRRDARPRYDKGAYSRNFSRDKDIHVGRHSNIKQIHTRLSRHTRQTKTNADRRSHITQRTQETFPETQLSDPTKAPECRLPTMTNVDGRRAIESHPTPVTAALFGQPTNDNGYETLSALYVGFRDNGRGSKDRC